MPLSPGRQVGAEQDHSADHSPTAAHMAAHKESAHCLQQTWDPLLCMRLSCSGTRQYELVCITSKCL